MLNVHTEKDHAKGAGLRQPIVKRADQAELSATDDPSLHFRILIVDFRC
jgi:hypothetical protein